MPRAQHIQMAFNTGEISPRLSARFDFAKYVNAVETLTNFIPFVHGGVIRRSGTRFVAEIFDSTKKARLIEFEFNTEQAYIIETGPGWMRFFRNDGQVFADDTDGVITNGTFDSDISGWTDISSGTGSISHDVGAQDMFIDGNGGGNEGRAEQSVTISAGFTGANHALKFRVTSGSIILKIGTTSGASDIFGPTTMAAGWHVQEFIPGATTFFITFESSGDSHLDDVSLIDNAPIQIDNLYSESDVAELQFAQDADIMWLTQRNHKPMTLTRRGDGTWDLVDFAPTADPFTAAGDFPRSVSFIEQRIGFAGTTNEPQAFWLSKTGDFFDFTIGVDDDDAMKFTIASGKVNVIVWTKGTDRGMVIGTAGSEYTAEGADGNPITPTNILVKERTQYGSREVINPIRVGATVLFVQRAGRKIREFTFNLESDSFVAPDLMLLAEHLLGPVDQESPGKGNVLTEIKWKQEPDQSLYAVRDDGVLLIAAFDRIQDVVGWSVHPISGTDAKVESVAVIPDPDTDKDQAWTIVQRTVAGGSKRYVEFFGEGKGSFYNDVLLDSAIPGSFGSPTDTITGLDHLEGETVRLLGDGAVYPEFTVTSGTITGIDPKVTDAEVGLDYTSTLKTLRPEIQIAQTAQGLKKQRPEIKVRVLETLGISINGQQSAFRRSSDIMGQRVPLFSEDIEVRNLGWDEDAQVTVEQKNPMPTHILAILGKLEVE